MLNLSTMGRHSLTSFVIRLRAASGDVPRAMYRSATRRAKVSAPLPAPYGTTSMIGVWESGCAIAPSAKRDSVAIAESRRPMERIVLECIISPGGKSAQGWVSWPEDHPA